MSFLRQTEQRRYFSGRSDVYVFPSSGRVLFFDPDAKQVDLTLTKAEFGALALTALEAISLDPSADVNLETMVARQEFEHVSVTTKLRQAVLHEYGATQTPIDISLSRETQSVVIKGWYSLGMTDYLELCARILERTHVDPQWIAEFAAVTGEELLSTDGSSERMA